MFLEQGRVGDRRAEGALRAVRDDGEFGLVPHRGHPRGQYRILRAILLERAEQAP
jgi:hypothetical protein